jgi:hypothetical protein
MAITRRGLREVSHNNSRCLRSRVIILTATSIQTSVRKAQRRRVNRGTESESSDKKCLHPRDQISRESVAIGNEMYEF